MLYYTYTHTHIYMESAQNNNANIITTKRLVKQMINKNISIYLC